MAFVPELAQSFLTAMNRLRTVVTMGFVLPAISLDMTPGVLQSAETAPVPSASTTAPSGVAD